jgi:hypothetical protein
LNAIFAASARHLSRVSDFDPYVADRHRQKCLNHLIPMLSGNEAITDENLLAATVIPRFLEEVEGTFPRIFQGFVGLISLYGLSVGYIYNITKKSH